MKKIFSRDIHFAACSFRDIHSTYLEKNAIIMQFCGAYLLTKSLNLKDV